MAKNTKCYRGTIRIEGKLIQQRFATKGDRDEWYNKMRQEKHRRSAGLEIEFDPKAIELVAAAFIRSRMNLETWKHDKYRLEHYVLPVFAGRPIHSITRKEWKTLLLGLAEHQDHCAAEPKCKKGLSHKTMANVRTMLSALYDFAIKEEPRHAVANPITEIELPKGMQRGIEFFHTAAECSAYLAHSHATHPVYGVFASIALNTGMREGEITSLRWECVDFDQRTISIRRAWSHSQRKIVDRTKGKRERSIGINNSLLGVLTRYRSTSPFNAESDLVVCNRKGAPWESKHLWEIHMKVLKAARLKEIRIHALRHTYATQYLANGGDIHDLSRILGHQDIKTTMRYAHVIPDRIHARASVVEIG